MPAKIISFETWKANHPPALICWQHGLACALAWLASSLIMLTRSFVARLTFIGFLLDLWRTRMHTIRL